MFSYRYLFDIALILLVTKVFGLLTKRIGMPQVVGALIAGIVLGPAVLNILHGTEFLSQVSELGVIVIMFTAGLGTDINELKQIGKSGFWVALLGVLLPLAGGTLFGFLFNRGELSSPGNTLLQNIFIGVILTATSVSITVETLKEMGRLNTKVGNTILAAALIDDILGLICLTLISSVGGDESIHVGTVLLKIALFFVISVVVGIVVYKIMKWYSNKKQNKNLQRFPIIAFVFCLFMAFFAERFFGVADIIGAFIAGLVMGSTTQAPYIESKFKPLSYLLLAPIFFASIGINIEIESMSWLLFGATCVLAAIAVLTKLIGCGIGAKIGKLSNRESLQVGVGMISRGEVALIVANKGYALNLMPLAFFGPVVFVVVLSTIITPILLKLVFRKEDKFSGIEASPLVDRYELVDQMDAVDQQLLEMDRSYKDKKHDSSKK